MHAGTGGGIFHPLWDSCAFDGPGNGAILVVDVSIRRQYLIRGYAVRRT